MIHNDNFLVFLIKVQIKTDIGYLMTIRERYTYYYSACFFIAQHAHYTNARVIELLFTGYTLHLGTWTQMWSNHL